MSARVEFASKKSYMPSKGTAGLQTRLSGCCTTVSILAEAGKEMNNSIIKKSVR